MTVRMSIMVAYVRWRNRARYSPESMDRSIVTRSEPAPVPNSVSQFCDVTETVIAGRRVVTLSPRRPSTTAHVIHTHGGAYVYAIQEAHWLVLARLADLSGTVMHVPLYALAPTASASDAYAFLDEVYHEVMATAGASPLVLSGDSAGGGLALGQAIRYRDGGIPQPVAVMLFSPWLDAEAPDRLDRSLQRREPMLSVLALRRAGRMWASRRPVTDPLISPINDSLVGLPPITTFVGGRDILLEDAKRLDAKVRDAGGVSHLHVWPTGFHVFMAATKTREARQVMRAAARLLAGDLRPAPR